MTKIVLVGYMASGKTTIGKQLAKNLNLNFIDLDVFIEDKKQLKIEELFKQKGEIYFRKLEHFWLNKLLKSNDNFVLSLGGGTPCYANNHLWLKDVNVESFYLKTPLATLTNRLKNTSRPLLQNIEDLPSFIGPHVFERSYFYNFAKHTIDCNNKDIFTICLEISLIIKKKY